MPEELTEPYKINWQTHIAVTTSDGKAFPMSRNAVKMCGTIVSMLENTPEGDETVFPLAKMDTGATLLVLEYIEYHADKPADPVDKPLRGPIEDVLAEWDKAYLDKLRDKNDHFKHEKLIQVMMAANFLNIRPLLDLTCGTVASMIDGKPADYIRKLLKIENDFTKEEQAKIDIENTWCEDKEQQ